MDQALALEIMIAGENVFLTGSPGSGKTYVLKKFIKHSRALDKHVSVTATTGLAATHLNGTTIHAWSGMGIREKLPPKFHNSLSQDRIDTINKTDVLIIDEISMMHNFQLDIVDEILRSVRNSDLPFGGIQVILCGDFFQLPPVSREKKLTSSFVTHSDVWDKSDLVICYLNEQHRQKDRSYAEILGAIRNNDLRRRHAEALLSRQRAFEDVDDVITQLHTTRANVDAINLGYLTQLKGKNHRYLAETNGSAKYVEILKKSCLASDKLLLKKGALVMCIRNDPRKHYVNGSLGVVTGFDRTTRLPKVRLKNGRQCVISPAIWELNDGDKKRAALSQIPLQLAWAITIHKCQGMTLDTAYVDLRKAFIEGMGYVALSRLRSLESLNLIGINQMALRVSSEALSIDKQLRAQAQEDIKRFAYLRNQASNKKAPELSKKLKTVQQKHPNAYKPWSTEDDIKLEKLLTKGLHISIYKIAQTFGRQPGSIRSRINKHFKDLTHTKRLS